MSSPELDKLIIDNWGDLEAARGRADEIEEVVFDAVNQGVKAWCDARGWSGKFKAPASMWLAPPQWTTAHGTRPAADAFFQFVASDTDDDQWYLTALMGLGAGEIAFRLKQELLSKRAWAEIVRDPDNVARLPAFTIDDTPAFCLPLRIDQTAVVTALETADFDDALKPLVLLLDQFEAAVPVIDPWLGPRSKGA